ncbi:MAG TPA: efflux RND transporter periplasmic adaptor subunit [Allosphingosinicella sp.]|jgi:RND family efflux transporter MFP subunit
MNMVTRVTAEGADGEAAPAAARLRRLPLWQKGALLLVPLGIAAAGVSVATGEPTVAAPPPPPMVTVATPLVRDVAEWDEHIGRFEASRSVEVRPRVSGAVIGVHFTDGAMVRAGQLLFTIDPRPFAAALAEARAGLGAAQSDIELARTDLGRALRLREVDAVSQSDVDRIRARLRSGEAALAAAQARVRARALDLEFTRVTAPIGGRISDTRVDAGNLVGAGEGNGATLLTTINAVDPIHFTFEGSEALFLKMKRAQQGGGRGARVDIRLQDETEYRWSGRLDFTDNLVDPRSGTIRGRAVLSNPGRFLTPGMFGNMRLATGKAAPAILVPDSAIGTDQARKVALVVGPKNMVEQREVALGPIVGGLRVVRSGLGPNDRVIVSGIQLAMPGTPVRIERGRIAPAAAVAGPGTAAPTSGEATLAR